MIFLEGDGFLIFCVIPMKNYSVFYIAFFMENLGFNEMEDKWVFD